MRNVMLLLAAPFLGAAFVVFLPMLGFALVGRELVRMVYKNKKSPLPRPLGA